jgi:hypothetical protein
MARSINRITCSPETLTDRGMTVIIAAGVLMAVSSGLVAVTGVPRHAALMAGAILMPFVLLAPIRQILAAMLLTGFLAAGMMEYFLRFEQMHWIVAFLFAALLARLPMLLLSSPVLPRSWAVNPIVVCLFCYYSAVLIAIGINMPPLLQTVAGVKQYAIPLGLLAVVACTRLPWFWVSVWRTIPVLMILQMPVALLQHVLFVKEIYRPSGMQVTWDAVVGTFGGNPEGGGASGALALFLCFGTIVTVALMRARLVSRRLAWCAWMSALMVMVLAEIKVLIFLMPIAFLIYNRRRLFRSPLSMFAWCGLSAVFIAGLLLTYSVVHWRTAGQNYETPEQIFAFLVRDEGSVDAQNRFTGEVSRIGALFLWWRHNVQAGDVSATLFGHGPAASKVSLTFGYGQAAKLYPFNLNTSSLSALLWDLGIAGALTFIGVLATAAHAGFTTARRYAGQDPAQQAIFETCAIGALLLIITLPYNLDAIETTAIQMLLAVIVGLALNSGMSTGGMPAFAKRFPWVPRKNAPGTAKG